MSDEPRSKASIARGNRPAGLTGRNTVCAEDRQSIIVATRALQQAYALLDEPTTPVERADALAQVRLAHASLDELLSREARRGR